MAATILRRGSCLCKRITFTISGPPARMIQCNCLNCQRSSGSAFLTNILYKDDQYKLTAGSDLLKTYKDADTTTGNMIERSFCSECGSNLFIKNRGDAKAKGNIVVCAGSVDGNHEEFVPQSELFANRRHQWVPAVKRPPSKKDQAKI